MEYILFTIRANDKRCLWIFKTKTFVCVNLGVMIPVDRDGIECRGFVWCPFLRSVCVCSVYLFVCSLMSHSRIFCIYGGVTIVFKVRIIYSHTRLSSHLSRDEFLSCLFIAFHHIQMTVSIKSPGINKGYWGPVLTQILTGLFVVSAKKKY